jgi:translation initiation factor 1A
VSLRDFQDTRGDVIHKYLPKEARELKSYGELPESVKIYEASILGEEQHDQVEFQDLRNFWNFV